MLKFGIMGAGSISRKFCEAALRSRDAQVVAVAAQDIRRAETFAREQGLPRAYGSYAQFLSDRSIDAVYIGNTTNLHYNCIKMCLAAGKHVICEKAMVETEAKAAECFSIASSKGLFLMEAMWSRFLPKTQKVREWVQSGRIGRVTGVQANIGFNAPNDPENRFYSPKLSGGAMYDLGVYPIDLLTYFTGLNITGHSATVIRAATGVDETVSLDLSLEGVPAHAFITLGAVVPEDCFIYGEKGYIRIPHIHWGNEAYLYDENRNETEKFCQPEEFGFRFEIEEAVNCIKEGMASSEVAPPEMTLLSSRLYDSILGTK